MYFEHQTTATDYLANYSEAKKTRRKKKTSETDKIRNELCMRRGKKGCSAKSD